MQISIRRCSHKIGAVSVSAAVQVEAVVDDERMQFIRCELAGDHDQSCGGLSAMSRFDP